jgi:carboxymethylenebutenolidase
VYGFYGGNDNRVSSTVAKSAAQMKQAGKTYESTVYDGAGHGFMRAGEQPDATPDNKKARDAAWVRVKEILGKI